MLLELLLHLWRRDDRQVGTRVQLPNHRPGEPLAESAHPRRVGPRVHRDVRVVRDEQRDVLPLACNVRRHVRDESRGRDVDQLGLEIVNHIRHGREALDLILAPLLDLVPRPKPAPQTLAHTLDWRETKRQVDLLVEREPKSADGGDRVAEEVGWRLRAVIRRDDRHVRASLLLVLEVFLEAVCVARNVREGSRLDDKLDTLRHLELFHRPI
mmetsp:Transcript_47981/g.133038  ORF Transcript_47981/g.133038 Transcript_47981/m.133038 type:complete len:212 (-) Transcript_47981:200-835(-)